MVLTDRKRILVTEGEEKQITKVLPNSSDRITVKGIPYKKSMIGYFDDPTHDELMGLQHVLNVFPGAKAINEGLNAKCRAQYSIQCEINNLCQSMSGVKSEDNPEGLRWQKLIGNKQWRESMRLKLWEQTDNWCDHKKNVCACEPGYQASQFKPRKDFIGTAI